MQYIPIITLVLVVILLGLVIVLLTRKPEKPELPQQIDPTASITALGTLVTQNLREGREAQSNQLSAMDKSLGDKMSGLTDQLGRFETRLQGFTAETTQNLTNIRETVDKNLHTFTGETKQNLETIRSTMDKNLHTFTGETKQDLENIRVTVDKNLRAMQEDNNKKLDDMRQIVDEKLQKTLSERMNESFKLVNERLEQVYKGLGEMDPEQLWETTMEPATRTLLQVNIDDAVEAERVVSELMGEQVEPRKEFIQKHARDVRFLDI